MDAYHIKELLLSTILNPDINYSLLYDLVSTNLRSRKDAQQIFFQSHFDDVFQIYFDLDECPLEISQIIFECK